MPSTEARGPIKSLAMAAAVRSEPALISMEEMLICLHMRDNTRSPTVLVAWIPHARCVGQSLEVAHLKHVQIWLRKMGTGKTGLLLHT